MADRLGTIKPVNVRTLWPREAQDFTPWLARDENMERLGLAVGIELEVESVEAAVGPYAADILAKDVGTDKYVVIENQFGQTNHDHLGKLITYASALDAAAVIWISEQFAEEHEKALNWLNDHIADSLAFYGVRLETFQIDDSRPAVQFNVVCRPAELARQAAAIKSAEPLSGARKVQFEFWTRFREKLLAAKVVSSAQAARPQYWYDVPLGRSGIHLSNIVNTWENRIGIRIYLNNKVADAALAQLLEQRAEIEHEIGEALSWNPNPENRDKIVVLHREADLGNKERFGEYVDWMVERTRRLRTVLMPRVKRLDLESTPATDEAES